MATDYAIIQRMEMLTAKLKPLPRRCHNGPKPKGGYNGSLGSSS
jgi:hypothetical protein